MKKIQCATLVRRKHLEAQLLNFNFHFLFSHRSFRLSLTFLPDRNHGPAVDFGGGFRQEIRFLFNELRSETEKKNKTGNIYAEIRFDCSGISEQLLPQPFEIVELHQLSRLIVLSGRARPRGLHVFRGDFAALGIANVDS